MKFIKFQIFLVSMLTICTLSIRIKNPDLPVNPLLNDYNNASQRNTQVGNTNQPYQLPVSIPDAATNPDSTQNLNTQPKLNEKPLFSPKNIDYKTPKIELLDQVSKHIPNIESAAGGGAFNFNILIGNSNATISNNNVKGY